MMLNQYKYEADPNKYIHTPNYLGRVQATLADASYASVYNKYNGVEAKDLHNWKSENLGIIQTMNKRMEIKEKYQSAILKAKSVGLAVTNLNSTKKSSKY